MSQLDRRAALQLLSAAAFTAVPAGTAGASVPRIAPPQGKLALSRRLVRTLGDGARIVVSRTWQVTFAPIATGYRVDGRQVSVTVDTPPGLAALAALERQRDERGLFPILLDPSGLIVEHNKFVDSPEIDSALDRVRSEIDTEDMSARLLLAKLQSSAETIVSRLPRDLLAPRSDGWTEQRSLPLPDGTTGEVTVRFVASRSPDGLLDRAERTVTSTVGSSSRISAEHWALQSA
ncbi:hypothetical protein [Tsuneonella mangrovi]|uniref:hypothetical protein n=1 Tax=Tsuneonella mangrovi TaxID=1982042 RepID=UPI000BA2251F|nr:hypothetical protein [Tsuneonella mangrovi]